MIKISKIEVQKNHDNRVSVFVDDEYFASLYLDTAVKYGVKKDAEYSEEKFAEIRQESENVLALNKANAYAGSAFKTTKQIRDYLKKKGYEKPTIDYVIEKLTSYNVINDKQFAESYVRTYEIKYGKNMLKTKLFEKGISKNIIEEVLEEFEAKEEIIDKLLIKKLGNKEINQDNLTKCIRFLSSRGFNFDEIKQAINRLKSGALEDFDD